MNRWGGVRKATYLYVDARSTFCRLTRAFSSGKSYDDGLTVLTRHLTGRNVLIVGDGDFGFAAAIAATKVCKHLIASTIDTKELANGAFQRAESNASAVLNSGYAVMYEIDAVALERFFPNDRFDVILWNFPHRQGKQNIKYNRILLEGYVSSASKIIEPDGAVMVSLAEGQSGCSASNKYEWDRSWKLPDICGRSGMLITHKEAFNPMLFEGYHPLGRRGHGGSFPMGNAQMHSLQHPGQGRLGVECSIYCHELHLFSIEDSHNLIDLEDSLSQAVRSILLEFSDVVWSVAIVGLYRSPSRNMQLAHVVQIAYGSVTVPVDRDRADHFRSMVVSRIGDYVHMEVRASDVQCKVSQSLAWYCAQAMRNFQSTRSLLDNMKLSPSTALKDFEESNLISLKKQLDIRKVENICNSASLGVGDAR